MEWMSRLVCEASYVFIYPVTGNELSYPVEFCIIGMKADTYLTAIFPRATVGQLGGDGEECIFLSESKYWYWSYNILFSRILIAMSIATTLPAHTKPIKRHRPSPPFSPVSLWMPPFPVLQGRKASLKAVSQVYDRPGPPLS